MDKKLLAKLIAGIFGTAPFLASISESALAAGTDIATAPLANRRSADIKPNIMLILDDSFSMVLDYMPQEVGNNDAYGPGYRNYLCNTIYYNPNNGTNVDPPNPLSPYLVPRDSTGADLNAGSPATFTSAYDNGFWAYDQIGQTAGSANMRDLSADQGWGYPIATSGRAAYYWKYKGSGAINSKSGVCLVAPPSAGAFATATGICAAASALTATGTTVPSVTTITGTATDAACYAADSTKDSLLWEKVPVSTTSSPVTVSSATYDERQRFANWYSYYRNRMQMTKSAIGRAFLPLIVKRKYRAGFITISPQQIDGGTEQSSVYAYNSSTPYNSKFLEIRNFDPTDLVTNQPYRWFNILYAQRPNGQTPLREGLSRVGRYYAGKNDGPNSGMIPNAAADPVQYACQQNFSILTTDGYWDSPAGSIGGFKLDYNAAMGNEDGNIAEVDAYGQNLPIGARPIYDGSKVPVITTDASNTYQNPACTFYYQNSQQILQSTSQPLRTTRQEFTWTRQPLQSTNQKFLATRTEYYSTRQELTWPRQVWSSTNQKFSRTQTEWATTTQLVIYTRWMNQYTNQLLASTVQPKYSTTQLLQSTTQRFAATSQPFASTVQPKYSTSQILSLTNQKFASTNQKFASTVQSLQGTSQVFRRTYQLQSCNASYGNCVGAQTCTPNEATACTSSVTGPTAISSCVAGTDTSTWVTTTCSTSTTSNTGISSCSPGTNTSTWVTTTCSTSTTSNVAASTCAASTNGSTWVTTTCSTSTTSNIAASSCSAGTNTSTWVTTTCSTSTASTGVTACSAGTNTSTWVTTTCSTSTLAFTGISSCTAGTSTNTSTWVTTTCSTSTTSNVAASACTAGTNTSTWITTTCSTSTVGFAATSACSAGTNTSTWVTTTCSTSSLPNVGVTTCPAGTNTSTWVTTTCSTSTLAFTGISSCTAGVSTNTSTWVTTTCSTSSLPNVAASACTAGTNTSTWITTTCSTSTTGPTTLATCTASTNTSTWVTTTCSVATSAPTGTNTCVPSTNTSTWVTTMCATLSSTFAVSSCVAAAATSTNSWVATTCATSTTTFAAASVCSAATNTSTWVTTFCSTSTTSNVAASACSAGTNTSTWVTTTCSTSAGTATATTSCAAGTNTSTWVTTVCSTSTLPFTGISACTTPGTNTSTWVTTTCSTSTLAFAGASACTASTNGSTWVTTSCSTSTTSNVAASACSAGTNGSTWVTTTCSTSVSSAAATASCSPATDTSTWVTTVCSTTTIPNVAVSSCGAGTNTSTWVTTTCSTSITTDIPIASCGAGTNTTTWVTTTCSTTVFAPTDTIVQTTCNVAATSGNGYISTSCAAQTGNKWQYQTRTQNRTDYYSDAVLVGWNPPSSTTTYNAWSAPSAWADLTACYPAGDPHLPATAPTNGRPNPGDPTQPSITTFDASCTSWPCAHTGATTAGSSNSLADVAQYYYKTDLRPVGTTGFNGTDVSANKVFVSATDTIEGDMAKWQHMTTFTMGLGVSGNKNFVEGYKSKPSASADFQAIRCLTAATDPNSCQDWPTPIARIPGPPPVDTDPGSRVDDLWHAAVNGRGQYFSASNPDNVYTGLQTTLQAINAQSGAGTGATTSTQDPVPGNDLTFRAGFRTVDWTGDIRSQQLYTGDNLSLEGTTIPGTVWSAQTKIDAQVGAACDNRNIYVIRMGYTTGSPSFDNGFANLAPFTWNSYRCNASVPPAPTGSASTVLNATEQNYFAASSAATPPYSSPFAMTSWSQFIDMSAAQKSAAQGANLVNFLRGQRGKEGFVASDTGKLFRQRLAVLGDIVGSQPRYVPPPNAQFTDTGYSLYKQKSGIVDRTPMLYVGANDGMLHAVNATATGGNEVWAAIPSLVPPNMWRLGDKEYSEGHVYLVDSTPSSGDVFDRYATVGSDVCSTITTASIARDCWKTILVAGLGAGGKGYYALDITNPSSPKALWEFNYSDTCYDSSVSTTHGADCHLGLTFGQPMITKLVDGRWVVLVSSGLNNVRSGTQSLTGTVTVNATTLVTGVGTAFASELVAGQSITINGEVRTVQSITSNTQLLTATAFTGSGSYAATAAVWNSGDGKGYLYVLDAITGKILKKLGTGVGSATVGAVAIGGTLTLNGSTLVTGSGSAFTTELVPGQNITINGETRTIQNIASDTQLTVSAAFTGSGGFAGTQTRSGASNLGYINAYVENFIQDNTTLRVYGGDGQGNVWRFTLKGVSDSSDDVVRLATLLDASGNPQPITTTPQLMNVGASQTRMVFVGTGRYLGESDLSDTQTQTVYGLAENLNITSSSAEYLSNASSVLPTAGLTLRQQLNQITLSIANNVVETKVIGDPDTTVTTVKTPAGGGASTTTTVTYPTTPAGATPDTIESRYAERGASTPACSVAATAAGVPCGGWYADLPANGERVNLDMRLVLGSLIVPTNVTNVGACDSGGNSWLNVFDAATGAEVPNSPFKSGRYMPGAVTVGVSLVRGRSGRILSVLTKSDDTQQVTEVPVQQGSPLGRRTGWRDLLGN